MSRTVTTAARAAKRAHFPEGNQNFPRGNQISPVMQKVRGLLPPQKTAWHLHCLTGQPLSTCQKALSGARDENREMLVALLRSRLWLDVLRVIMSGTDAAPADFTDLIELSEVREEERSLAKAQRQLNARRQAILQRGEA